MTTFDVNLWEAKGKQELTLEIHARSFIEAVQQAQIEVDAIAREQGTAWVLMSVCDDRFNSPEALNRLAQERSPSGVS